MPTKKTKNVRIPVSIPIPVTAHVSAPFDYKSSHTKLNVIIGNQTADKLKAIEAYRAWATGTNPDRQKKMVFTELIDGAYDVLPDEYKVVD